MTQNQLRLIPELKSSTSTPLSNKAGSGTSSSFTPSSIARTNTLSTRGSLKTLSTRRRAPINLTLIEGSVQADFGIDESTRNIGLSGIAAAREMLRQANEAIAA